MPKRRKAGRGGLDFCFVDVRGSGSLESRFPPLVGVASDILYINFVVRQQHWNQQAKYIHTATNTSAQRPLLSY